jgi:hypothetical protein
MNSIELFKQQFTIPPRQNIQLYNASIYEIILYGINIMERINIQPLTEMIFPIFFQVFIQEADLHSFPLQPETYSKYNNNLLFPTDNSKIQVFLHVLMSNLLRRVNCQIVITDSLIDEIYNLAPPAAYNENSVTYFRNNIKLSKQTYASTTIDKANIQTLVLLLLDKFEFTENKFKKTNKFCEIKNKLYSFISTIQQELAIISALSTPNKIVSVKYGNTPIMKTGIVDPKVGMHILIICILNRIRHIEKKHKLYFPSLEKFRVKVNKKQFAFADEIFQLLHEAIHEKASTFI